MLRPALSPRDRRHARHVRDLRARGRLAVRPLARSRGCCSARSSPSTDGAAIFALLRGSTLRRRLARTLEGEAGFNDPVAVLLVIGFIDWIEQPGLRRARHGSCCSSARSASARWSGSRVGWLAVRALRRVRLATAGPLPGRDAVRGRRSRSAAPTTLHGSGFLAVYLAGLVLGLGAHPGASRPSPSSTRGSPGSRRSRCSSRSACSCSRAQLGDVAARGHGARAGPRVRRAAAGRVRVATALRRLRRRASGSCSAGRACAARCRWCSRPSR